METIFPPKVRLALYIFAFLGSAIVVPLDLNHVIATWVLPTWSSFVSAVCALAGFNVTLPGKK